MIQPKILLPFTWKTKESWDDEVNNEIKKKIFKWEKQLKYFKNIKIPRCDGVIQFKYPYFCRCQISEIRKLTTSEDWFHISTDQNPADILSRGCGSKQLQKLQWWQGPPGYRIRRNSGQSQL
ncbi:uncharacterized protein NPIL_466211 [Nephila pilipes]|uniref:Uncharacterized protein n=1 Tax=Nephila pilipes TaxID=299642 RepID=A0A8X6TU24_NEPPI|nr:uncharacterized protein NPIL_466211 [Nephila pilipes]